MSFAYPQILLLLLLLPLLVTSIMPSRKKPVLGFSSHSLFSGIGKTQKPFIAVLSQVILILGVSCLILALARPREDLGEEQKATNGIAIQLVMDRSSSMNAEVETGGQFVRRMDITKKTFSDFVFGNNSELPGRENDLIGLITFARFADTLAPLSTSHDILKDFLSSIDTVTTQEEDGTSIGDAIALAAARLSLVDEKNDAEKGFTIKSRIIILLTDGENNAGDRSPKEAAEFAQKHGVKIYSIGFAGQAYRTVQGIFGTQRVPYASAVDEETLKTISDITGGSYFPVNSPEDLINVYKVIDELEKSEVLTLENPKYKELFHIPLLIGLLLILLAFLGEQFLYRRFP